MEEYKGVLISIEPFPEKKWSYGVLANLSVFNGAKINCTYDFNLSFMFAAVISLLASDYVA